MFAGMEDKGGGKTRLKVWVENPRVGGSTPDPGTKVAMGFIPGSRADASEKKSLLGVRSRPFVTWTKAEACWEEMLRGIPKNEIPGGPETPMTDTWPRKSK